MRRSISHLLFSPDAIAPFLFGSVALSLIGSALYDLLKDSLGAGNRAVIGIAVGSLAIFVFAVWLLRRYLDRVRHDPFSVKKATPERRKGLILLVSSVDVCRKAIAFHGSELEHCWLVHSDQARSYEGALDLDHILTEENVRAHLVEVKDVFDPLVLRDTVNAIYDSIPRTLEPRDVILDFTGMTAVASVGSVLACLGEDRPIQYTPAVYSASLKERYPGEPIEILLSTSPANISGA